jgi:hypothetical protein
MTLFDELFQQGEAMMKKLLNNDTPLPTENEFQQWDKRLRVFGWDNDKGSAVTLNQVCITPEQLEQIRALRNS